MKETKRTNEYKGPFQRKQLRVIRRTCWPKRETKRARAMRWWCTNDIKIMISSPFLLTIINCHSLLFLSYLKMYTSPILSLSRSLFLSVGIVFALYFSLQCIHSMFSQAFELLLLFVHVYIAISYHKNTQLKRSLKHKIWLSALIKHIKKKFVSKESSFITENSFGFKLILRATVLHDGRSICHLMFLGIVSFFFSHGKMDLTTFSFILGIWSLASKL